MTLLQGQILNILIFAYLKDRVAERVQDGDLPSAGSLPGWPQWMELDQSKARGQEQLLALLRGPGPSTAAILCCFPWAHKHRAVSEVEQVELKLTTTLNARLQAVA